MPISYDARLFRSRMAVIQNNKWAKKVLAYAKCVRATGGDWSNPDCMKLVWPMGPYVTINPPDEPSLIEELLAQMPEEAQQHAAELLLEAQARLIEQSTAELEELNSQL